MTDMSRDSIVDRHCLRQRHVPHAVAENLGEVSCMQLYRPGEWLWIDFNGKYGNWTSRRGITW